MGLADTLAALIRPCRRGLFTAKPTAADDLAVRLAISTADARELIATLQSLRERTAADLRASFSDVTTRDPSPPVATVDLRDDFPQPRLTWGGVALKGFADSEYLSVEPPPITVLSQKQVDPNTLTDEQRATDRKIRKLVEEVFRERLPAELAQGIRDAKLDIVY